MASYAHRPAASGLHAKLLRELSDASGLHIDNQPGRPNHIVVWRGRQFVWTGHRDLMPSAYRGAHDPHNLLGRPASD